MTYYDEIAESYNELHGEEQKKKVKIILDYLKTIDYNLEEKKVLDVGCGTGIATENFATQGIDPSKELVKQCKFPAIVGKGEELPFEDKSFDVTICLTAIHNFEDFKKGIEEMKRVAKELVIISTLKKSEKNENIEEEIKKQFKKIKEIDEEKDLILICSQ